MKKEKAYRYHDIMEINSTAFVLADGNRLLYNASQYQWVSEHSFVVYLHKADMKKQGKFDKDKHHFIFLEVTEVHWYRLCIHSIPLIATPSFTQYDKHTCFLKNFEKPGEYHILELKKHQFKQLETLAKSIGLIPREKAMLSPLFWNAEDDGTHAKIGCIFQNIAYVRDHMRVFRLQHAVFTFVVEIVDKHYGAGHVLLHREPAKRLDILYDMISGYYAHTPSKWINDWVFTQPFPKDDMVTEEMADLIKKSIQSHHENDKAICATVCDLLDVWLEVNAAQLPYTKEFITEKAPSGNSFSLPGVEAPLKNFFPGTGSQSVRAIKQEIERIYGDKAWTWVTKIRATKGTKQVANLLRKNIDMLERTPPQRRAQFGVISGYKQLKFVLAFIQDGFPLTGTELLTMHEGKYFSQLPKSLQEEILGTLIPIKYSKL